MKLIFGTILTFGIAAVAASVPDASEWTKPRNFHVAFDETFAPNIMVAESSNDSVPEAVVFSANNAYWFYVEPYDVEASEQRIVLDGNRGVTITLKDAYLNFPVRVTWVNEKLVFISVWWGRVAGTEMIFDIEKNEFVYREMVYDGAQLYQQTQWSLGRESLPSGVNAESQRSAP